LNGQFSVVYAGEVQAATWLRAVHGKAERPREQWKCIERRWREVRRVHFMDDVVVEGIGHVFEERQTIDVKGRLVETVITHPTGTGHIGRGQVEGLHWVIEIRKINRCISLGDWLELRLGNEKFVFLRREMFTLGSVQIGIHTINLWRRTQVTQTRTALDSQFNIMILEPNEWEGLGPIFTEEEWDYVVIPGGSTDTLRVIGYLRGGDRTRSFRLSFSEENVVDTLHVQGIHAANFLASDV
tara:strand:+ start:82 stop:804 length:723 start_codon:yes stop_codon:yes gene_type:complete